MEAKGFSEETDHDPIKLLQNERRDTHTSVVLRDIDTTKLVLDDRD